MVGAAVVVGGELVGFAAGGGGCVVAVGITGDLVTLGVSVRKRVRVGITAVVASDAMVAVAEWVAGCPVVSAASLSYWRERPPLMI